MKILPLAVLLLALLTAAWWNSPFSLKIRVAVQLLGWDGLLTIAKETVAQRLVGHRKTKSRNAYHHLVKTLHDVELQYLVPSRRIVDAETVAEGHRFLAHALRYGFAILDADLDRPYFEEMVGPHQKILGDNPDAKYFNAYLRRDGSFKVWGKRVPGEVYLSFTIYEAPCVGCFSQRVVADVNNRQLSFEPDGSYVLYISPTKPPGAVNWLSLGQVSAHAFPQLITRHYFENELSCQMDPSIHPQVQIAPLHPVAMPAVKGLQSDADMAERLGRVESFITSHTVGMPQDPSAAPKWFSFTPNVFGPAELFRGANEGQVGAVDIAYSAAPWKFDPFTQGLEITGRMPNCVFANVVLWNVFLQTLSYETGRAVSLNRKQMKSLRLDGSFKILLSKSRPAKLPEDVDWMDNEERKDGTIFFRFLLPDGDLETPKAKVVLLSAWD